MSHQTNAAANRALIVFARYPRVGLVKTRLAATLGAESAAAFYRCCAERLFAEAGRLCCRRYLFYAAEAQAEEMQAWVGPRFTCLAQREGDLGERMAAAFARVFAEGNEQAVIVGTDIPDLTAAILTQAFERLAHEDIVIGPAYDGGYYLLGMRHLHRELFREMAWSTAAVFEQTLQVVAHLGLQVYHLPMLRDIDTEEDLRQWLAVRETKRLRE